MQNKHSRDILPFIFTFHIIWVYIAVIYNNVRIERTYLVTLDSEWIKRVHYNLGRKHVKILKKIV